MTSSKVEQFLDELHSRSGRKRPAPPSTAQPSKQLLLPIYLNVDQGHKEAREQLLWRLGDSSANPAIVARAFCQQHIQSPQQLEREAQRVQRDLERMVELHKDLLAAPTAPTLVKLDVRVTLPHLGAVFMDEPLWDLSAPRSACESYVSALCCDLGLDWGAHNAIMRRMKDAIDAAKQDWAAGRAKVVELPVGDGSGASLLSHPPSRLPQVVHLSEQQRQQLRKQMAAAAAKRAAAANAGAGSGSGGGGAQVPPSPEGAAAAAAAGEGLPSPGFAAGVKLEGGVEGEGEEIKGEEGQGAAAATAGSPAGVQPAAAAAGQPAAAAGEPAAAAAAEEAAAGGGGGGSGGTQAAAPAGPADQPADEEQGQQQGQGQSGGPVRSPSPSPPPPQQQDRQGRGGGGIMRSVPSLSPAPSSQQLRAGSEQTSGQDMPDLPDE